MDNDPESQETACTLASWAGSVDDLRSSQLTDSQRNDGNESDEELTDSQTASLRLADERSPAELVVRVRRVDRDASYRSWPLQSFFVLPGTTFRSRSIARDRDIMREPSALAAFEAFSADLRHEQDTSPPRFDDFLSACDTFTNVLRHRGQDLILPHELGIAEAVQYSFGVNVQSATRPTSSAQLFLILLTFPVSNRNMWLTASGVKCHTANIEEELLSGLERRDRERALYLDSIPIPRHPRSATDMKSDVQRTLFEEGFDRILKAPCKVLILKHPANRFWFMQELQRYRHGCQEVFDLGWYYQQQRRYRRSIPSIFIRNLAGHVGDDRLVLFVNHPSAIGSPGLDPATWEIIVQDAILAQQIVADLLGLFYNSSVAELRLNRLLSHFPSDQNLFSAKLDGLIRLRSREISAEEFISFDDIPATLQAFIRSKINVDNLPENVSVLYAALSTISRSVAGLLGLAILEAAEPLSTDQRVTLEAARVNPAWTSQFRRYGIETSSFRELRAAKCKESWSGIEKRVWQSLMHMRHDSPRFFCMGCRDPVGFCSAERRFSAIHRRYLTNSECRQGSIFYREAVERGLVSREDAAKVEMLYLRAGRVLR